MIIVSRLRPSLDLALSISMFAYTGVYINIYIYVYRYAYVYVDVYVYVYIYTLDISTYTRNTRIPTSRGVIYKHASTTTYICTYMSTYNILSSIYSRAKQRCCAPAVTSNSRNSGRP